MQRNFLSMPFLVGVLVALLLGSGLVGLYLFSRHRAAPPTSEYYSAKAQQRYEIGNYSGAIKEYTRAIQLNPGDRDSYFGRANAYLQVYVYQKALEDYTKAIELEPTNSTYYASRALVHSGLGNYKAVLADYDKAIALDRRNGELYRKRAYIKEKHLNYKVKDLVADWKKAIEFGSQDEHLFISYGNYLNNQLQDYAGALRFFNKTLQLNPESALAKKNAEIARS
ncbi:MAG: tetratricopeptide repeat protein, partial [Candidatus Margulisbacteria bacterium]|nr:tetratricopeptide repeat protein [Candidatus Margulisiibacteriota bacterium]